MNDVYRNQLENGGLLLGRVLLSALFLWAGAGKLMAYADTQAYMTAMGVSPALLPPVVALELLGGLALLLGMALRPAALLLAGFTLLAGLLFHLDGSDHVQTILLMKNLAIAGGLLALGIAGAGDWSWSGRRGRPVSAPAESRGAGR